ADRKKREISTIDDGDGEQSGCRSTRSVRAESPQVAAGEENFAHRPPGMLLRQWQPKERNVGFRKAVVRSRNSPGLLGGGDDCEYGVGSGDHLPPSTTTTITSTPLFGRLQQALKKLTAKETPSSPGATTSTYLANSD
ncbi:unnamed protein product, partial [Sphacelaria rigidula]